MMLRRILPYYVKPQRYNTLLSILRLSLQNKHTNYSLYLPLKHFVYGNYNLYFVSSIFRCIFATFDWKFLHTVKTNEVQNLCDFIISQDSEKWENERIEELKKVISFLLKKGYSNKEIKEKFLTYLISRDCSYNKIKILSDIHHDIILLLPLSTLSTNILQLVSNSARIDKYSTKEFANRIEYLSQHLELEPSQLVLALTKHSSLLTMKISRLHAKMNILKNANISSKYIVKDLWIFNYNEQLLANRIQAAVKAGVELKPWMLRCSEKFFESILTKYSETQRILNGETVHSYLAKKLDCKTEYVDYMMEKNKLLKSINIPKLEQMINFLYEKGYTAEEIRLFPRVFCSSVQTLEKRIEELQNVRSTLPTLAQLCLSNKKFQFLNKRNRKQHMLN